MSSPVTKTPASKSERMRLALESADKMIAESQKKRREDAEKHESDMEALREQMRAALEGEEDKSEEVHEPRQLLSDLPLKKEAASDSEEDQDSPGAGKQTTVPVDSDEWVPPDFEPFVTGRPDVYVEEDSLLESGVQLLNVPGQDTARRASRRDTDSSLKPASQDARGRGVRSYVPKATGEVTKLSTLRTTDQELTRGQLARENYRLMKLVNDLQRGGVQVGARDDDHDDRVRSVRSSVGFGRAQRAKSYDRQTTVELINSLDLLKDALKGESR